MTLFDTLAYLETEASKLGIVGLDDVLLEGVSHYMAFLLQSNAAKPQHVIKDFAQEHFPQNLLE